MRRRSWWSLRPARVARLATAGGAVDDASLAGAPAVVGAPRAGALLGTVHAGAVVDPLVARVVHVVVEGCSAVGLDVPPLRRESAAIGVGVRVSLRGGRGGRRRGADQLLGAGGQGVRGGAGVVARHEGGGGRDEQDEREGESGEAVHYGPPFGLAWTECPVQKNNSTALIICQ